MERFDITIRMYSADASGTQYVWDKVSAEEGDFVLYTDAQATIEALQAIIKQMGEQACVLAKDGMAAKAQVEALQRERDHVKKMAAVQKEVADNQTWHVRELTAALNAERANRESLEACVDRDVKKIKDLQTQLSQLQALVRVAKAEVWKEAAVKYALWVGEDSEVPADPHLDGYERFEDYCHDRAALDATTPAGGGQE